jgi:hypothetical protein
MRLLSSFRALTLALLVISVSADAGMDRAPGRSIGIQQSGGFPLAFEENRGQSSPDLHYLTRGHNFSVGLGPGGIAWILDGRRDNLDSRGDFWRVEMTLEGAREEAPLVPEEPLPTVRSYIKGADPKQWLTGIRTYRQVRYRDVYPGIDLLVYGRGVQIEYDFEVRPGADPSSIRLEFSGADVLALDGGDLVLSTSGGEIRHERPFAYQAVDGTRKRVDSRYRLLDERTVGFETGAYDPTLKLVIDPVLVFSTYLGGSKEESIESIGVDSEGNVYVGGSSGSMDYPILNASQPDFAGGGSPLGDVVVSKVDASGGLLAYSTFIGGSGTDVGRSIAVDAQGAVYVTGTTFSSDFPSTPGSYQPECSGQCPFLVKLTPDGSGLAYGTFVGRSADGMAVAIDSAGQAVITGRTASSSFPVANAFQSGKQGDFDGFVSKLNAAGSALVFSTYVGGTADDNLSGEPDIATDLSGNIYVTGATESTDFPIMNAAQSANGGADDVFLTKFSAEGTLIYSTYIGGAGDDHGRGVAADPFGNAYVTGETKSTDFPTVQAFQAAFGGGLGVGDAFLSKIGPNGGALILSTYLGGPLGERGAGVAVDELGRPVVAGLGANGLPLKDAFREFGGQDAFVTKFSADGSSLVYSLNLGGLGGDSATAVAALGTRVFVAGNSNKSNFPLAEALQPRPAGGTTEGFITQIAEQGSLHFAQIANGTGTVSEMLLTNSSMLSASQATVVFADDNGLPLAMNVTVTQNDGSQLPQGQVATLDVTVPPLGLVRITTDGVGPLVSGSAGVTYDNPLGGVIRYTIAPLGTAGVGESRPLKAFISPVRRQAGIDTGIAIMNLEDSNTAIRLTLRDRTGQQVTGGLFTTTLVGRGHLARFINELFPNANTEGFEGTLTVEATSADALIGGTALELGPAPGQFTTLPVTPLP